MIDEYEADILALLGRRSEGLHFNGIKKETKINTRTLTKKIKNLLENELIFLHTTGKQGRKIYRITDKGYNMLFRWQVTHEIIKGIDDLLNFLMKDNIIKGSGGILKPIITPLPNGYKQVYFFFLPAKDLNNMIIEYFNLNYLRPGDRPTHIKKDELENINRLMAMSIMHYITSNVKGGRGSFYVTTDKGLFVTLSLPKEFKETIEKLVKEGVFKDFEAAVHEIFIRIPQKHIATSKSINKMVERNNKEIKFNPRELDKWAKKNPRKYRKFMKLLKEMSGLSYKELKRELE